MHYYKRNLGDYAKKTGRLTMLQHGAYTLLIDSCYDREKFPTLEQAIEWTWASTEAEIEAVKFVLSRFFTLGQDGEYVQERILAELLDYHSKADKNKTIAIEREAKRRENRTNRAQAVDESPPNHKPITNNHKPSNTPPDGVSQSVWDDFVKQRKAKKAPVSDTVITKIRNQAEKAGWSLEDALAEICARGWTGFNADWVKEKQTFAQQAADVARTTVPPPPNQDAALKQIMEDRKKAVPMPAHIKQMIESTLKKGLNMSNQDELFIQSIALSLYLKDKIKKFFETDNLNEDQKNALLWATIFLADNATEISEISKEDFIEMYRGEDA